MIEVDREDLRLLEQMRRLLRHTPASLSLDMGRLERLIERTKGSLREDQPDLWRKM
jgi:hypothetical protein